MQLRGRLDLWADPDYKRPAKDDPVYDWARRAREALVQTSPEDARDFFGATTPRVAGLFMTAFGNELEALGRCD